MSIIGATANVLPRVTALGSIAAACSELRISQSSILAAIQHAEQSLGMRVFNKRKGHGVTVTPAGQKFLVSSRHFLSAGNEFYASLSEMAQAREHTIRIGSFSPLSTLVMPPVIKRIFPEGGNADFALFEGGQTELRNWLEAGMLDAVVTYDIGKNFSGGITPICKVPPHALLQSDDPLATKKAVKLVELSNRPFVLLDLPETTFLSYGAIWLVCTAAGCCLENEFVRNDPCGSFKWNGIFDFELKAKRRSKP